MKIKIVDNDIAKIMFPLNFSCTRFALYELPLSITEHIVHRVTISSERVLLRRIFRPLIFQWVKHDKNQGCGRKKIFKRKLKYLIGF